MLARYDRGMATQLLIPGKTLRTSSNWVYGDRFFDREAELCSLRERVEDGTHTLLTAQRRMGKTSLVRELLRRLDEEGRFATVFVDLEGAMDAPDAVAEIAARAWPLQGVRSRLASLAGAGLREVRSSIEELAFAELKVKLRGRLDAGSWQRMGDGAFEALAASGRPVVLAIDELPIFISRLLKGHDYRMTPERRAAADGFMGWLRRCAQDHCGRVCLIVSGSVGLEPVLNQAGLSAHAGVYMPFDLRPWPHHVAAECLAALARGHGIVLPEDVRDDICRRLRSCVPHHVQRFFHHLHEHLVRHGRTEATLADVERVYKDDLLGARGQTDLQHYEERLRTVLGEPGYAIARRLLTETALSGGLLTYESASRHADGGGLREDEVAAQDVLHVLEHDGYLERLPGGYGFVSGLLEEWWLRRHGGPAASLVRI